MNKKLEVFKVEFLKGLEFSDYKSLCEYDRLETCLEIILIRDLLSSKTKFKIFKIGDSKRFLIQIENCISVVYMIRQNGSRFELYELNTEKLNEYEEEVYKRFY